ncbi:MAG: lytic transglycosylase domain-containing protein [Pseudomonadota bacterium]
MCNFTSPSHAAAPEYQGENLISTLRNPAEVTRLSKLDAFNDPLSVKLLTWLHLSQYADQASFNQIRHFIMANPDWPRESTLARKAEEKLPANLRPYEVKSWFDRYAPQTTDGLLRYLQAIQQLGYEPQIARALKAYWLTGSIDARDFTKITRAYGRYLTADLHAERIDNLIWRGRISEAAMILPLVPDRQRALFQARILLAGQENGVDAAIDKVSAQDQLNPGLIYERARWRRRANDDQGALELLNIAAVDQSRHSGKWWRERHILIRRAMERQDFDSALQIAKKHRQKSGFSFASAEFLVGWLTLQYEKNPETAARHFIRLYEGVSSPISVSRAAYWTGRAYEAQQDMAEAQKWYNRAAEHSLFFYGQLANTRLGQHKLPVKWALAPDATKTQSPLIRNQWAGAIRILNNWKLSGHSDAFFAKLFNHVKSAEDYKYVAALSKSVGRYDQAIRAAKGLYSDHGIMLTVGYPTLPGINPDLARPSHLFGLIRQESVFNAKARSFAGAQGLMQLMPPTAAETSRKLGLPYKESALTQDPKYNTVLGTAYIEDLLKRYDGNLILATAAYNAGPGRVNGWIRELGDPRDPDIDILDWIETLPVYETRNYIQRVMEATRVYSELLRENQQILANSNHRL